MKLNFMSTRFLRILVAAGYLLMCLLAGGIMYLWHYEWKEIEALETENQRKTTSAKKYIMFTVK